MTFEWDIYKAIANIFKHGLGFEEAISVFDDDNALFTEIATETGKERRFQAIGRVEIYGKPGSRIATVIYTLRQNSNLCRIISARPSSRKERVFYEQQI